MAYLTLLLAILTETGATLSLRVAATGRRRWYVGVGVGYVVAFVLLAVTLSLGMALGVAYGIWAAAGVALTAVLSKLVFGEALNRTMVAGIGLIVVGVLLVELGAAHWPSCSGTSVE